MNTKRKNTQWMKLRTDAVNSAALRMISGDDFRYFTYLLCLKGDGTLDQPDKDMARKEVAIKLRVTQNKLDKILGRLEYAGLVCRDTMQPIAEV